jgi:hypothetical protein
MTAVPDGKLASDLFLLADNRRETFHVGSKSTLIANRRDVIVGVRFSGRGIRRGDSVRRFFLT